MIGFRSIVLADGGFGQFSAAHRHQGDVNGELKCPRTQLRVSVNAWEPETAFAERVAIMG